MFAAVESDDNRWIDAKSVPQNEWINTSNHDSCWNSDGLRIINELYFKMSEAINEELQVDTGTSLPPSLFHQFNTFCGFHEMFKVWNVQVAADDNDLNRYRRIVKDIQPIEKG